MLNLGHCICDSSLVIVDVVYVEGGLCTLGVGFAEVGVKMLLY
jgi:hypothetical protein